VFTSVGLSVYITGDMKQALGCCTWPHESSRQFASTLVQVFSRMFAICRSVQLKLSEATKLNINVNSRTHSQSVGLEVKRDAVVIKL